MRFESTFWKDPVEAALTVDRGESDAIEAAEKNCGDNPRREEKAKQQQVDHHAGFRKMQTWTPKHQNTTLPFLSSFCLTRLLFFLGRTEVCHESDILLAVIAVQRTTDLHNTNVRWK